MAVRMTTGQLGEKLDLNTGSEESYLLTRPLHFLRPLDVSGVPVPRRPQAKDTPPSLVTTTNLFRTAFSFPISGPHYRYRYHNTEHYQHQEEHLR